MALRPLDPAHRVELADGVALIVTAAARTKEGIVASILMKRGGDPLGVDTFPITQLDGLGARAARLGELVGLDAFTINAAIRGLTETVDVRLLQIARAKATKDSKEEAQAVAIVRDDEPAADPVDGQGLLGALRALLNRHLVLPDHAAETVALWIVHTYCFEVFDFTPYLAVMSPVKRCGKTTLLDIILELARRALNGDSITPAVVFRVVQKYKPALLLDEADQVFKTDDELRQLFNSGFRRNGRALRCDGDDFEPTAFSTFCPKAIGLIGELDGKAATTGDRSIYVRMRRKGRGERREKVRSAVIAAQAQPLRRWCARWAQDNLEALGQAAPAMPDQLDDRASDIWLPLVAIADRVGGEWPRLARAAAVALSGEREEEDRGVELLVNIRTIFETLGKDKIPTAGLLSELVALDESPWASYNYKAKGDDRHLQARQLSSLLKPYGIKPKTVREGAATPKGYVLADFSDAFSRYTPGYPQQRNNSANQQETDGLDVADESGGDRRAEASATSNPSVSNSSEECCGVADRTPAPAKRAVPGNGKPGASKSDIFSWGGQIYRAGDTLPDGRRVTLEDGIPIVVKPARPREPGEDDVDPVEASVLSDIKRWADVQ